MRFQPFDIGFDGLLDPLGFQTGVFIVFGIRRAASAFRWAARPSRSLTNHRYRGTD
jgi:hypothetical protein